MNPYLFKVDECHLPQQFNETAWMLHIESVVGDRLWFKVYETGLFEENPRFFEAYASKHSIAKLCISTACHVRLECTRPRDKYPDHRGYLTGGSLTLIANHVDGTMGTDTLMVLLKSDTLDTVQLVAPKAYIFKLLKYKCP